MIGIQRDLQQNLSQALTTNAQAMDNRMQELKALFMKRKSSEVEDEMKPCDLGSSWSFCVVCVLPVFLWTLFVVVLKRLSPIKVSFCLRRFGLGTYFCRSRCLKWSSKMVHKGPFWHQVCCSHECSGIFH